MNNNRCLYCTSIIPEGRHVCWSCEHGTVKSPKPPTDKQIKLADDIANTLNIDFPLSSKDFTAAVYWEFIKNNIDEAKSYWDDFDDYGWDDEMMWFSPLNQ